MTIEIDGKKYLDQINMKETELVKLIEEMSDDSIDLKLLQDIVKNDTSFADKIRWFKTKEFHRKWQLSKLSEIKKRTLSLNLLQESGFGFLKKNVSDELTYISTYTKDRNDISENNIRHLFKDENGKECIIYLDKLMTSAMIASGQPGRVLSIMEDYEFHHDGKDLVNNNIPTRYYYLSDDFNRVIESLSNWMNTDEFKYYEIKGAKNRQVLDY